MNGQRRVALTLSIPEPHYLAMRRIAEVETVRGRASTGAIALKLIAEALRQRGISDGKGKGNA